jgi:hypothetical protein
VGIPKEREFRDASKDLVSPDTMSAISYSRQSKWMHPIQRPRLQTRALSPQRESDKPDGSETQNIPFSALSVADALLNSGQLLFQAYDKRYEILVEKMLPKKITSVISGILSLETTFAIFDSALFILGLDQSLVAGHVRPRSVLHPRRERCVATR